MLEGFASLVGAISNVMYSYLLIIVLLVKPTGLLGKPMREKV